MITAATYRRISDDKESDEHGITSQAEDLAVLAADRGITVVADYSDNDIGASTRSKKRRPGYVQMIADARDGKFQVIMAYSSSRLTRRPRESLDLIELGDQHGIKFVYCQTPSYDLTTADGRKAARNQANDDAAESERIGERVARARARQVKAGTYGGGRRPFGFRTTDKKGILAVDDVEADVMREAARRLLNGISVRSVAAEMNEAGLPTVAGRPWQSETLRYVLTKDLAKQILGEHVWLGVKALFANPNRRQGPGSEPSHVMSGRSHCANCGSPMQFNLTRANYRCKVAKRGCAVINAAFLESYVSGAVCRWLAQPANVDLLIKPAPGVDVDKLRVEIAADRAMLDELLADKTARLITRDQWLTESDKIRARVATAESQLAATTSSSPAADLAREVDIPAAWEALPLATRRAIISELAIVIVEPARGRDADDCVWLVWRPEQES